MLSIKWTSYELSDIGSALCCISVGCSGCAVGTAGFPPQALKTRDAITRMRRLDQSLCIVLYSLKRFFLYPKAILLARALDTQRKPGRLDPSIVSWVDSRSIHHVGETRLSNIV